MILTIHQPDLMPWLGFFNKIAKADMWVILDHTLNNPRDAAFWCRRVKILLNGNESWFSLPLEKPIEGIIGIPINQIKYSLVNPSIFSKNLQVISQNYKRAPYFNEVIPLVENFMNSDQLSMSHRNLDFIFEIIKRLEIKTQVVYSSDLDCHKTSNELLIQIAQKMKSKTYLCGGGAGGYQKDELFTEKGIQVIYNDFKHPEYFQFNSKKFIPGLSIIDSLMNLGYDGVKKILFL